MLKLAWVVSCLGILIIGSCLSHPAAHAQGGDPDVLRDEVVFGAWLYEGNCVSCHGTYDQERVAGPYDDEDELAEAIAGGPGGCTIDWSYRYDGPFRSREIKALVAFVLEWEALDGPPDLPELPPQPTPTLMPTSTPLPEDATAPPTPKPQLDPEVEMIIEGSELAMGAYFYTQECHRCHLAYDVYRMGAGFSAETIERNIQEGKVGTSMPAFSRREGGDLKVREIRAIVRYITAFESLNAPPALPEILFMPPTPDPQDFLMIPLPEIEEVRGDRENGEVLFARHCMSCHGFNGEGRLGPSLAKTWPSLRPDLTVKATLMVGVPENLMPAWERRGGGELTEEEINDLVSFVLLLPPQPPLPDPAQAGTQTGRMLMLLLLSGAILSSVTIWALGRRLGS